MRLQSFDRSKFDNEEGLFFGFELDVYRDYIDFNEKNIDRETEKIGEEFEALADKLKTTPKEYDPRYFEYLQDNYIDTFKKLDYDFRQNLRRSQIIMLYSFLELKLKEGCNSYAEAHNKEYTISQLKGQNDLDKIKIFFKRSMNIKIDDLNPEWKFLNDLRKVRNRIVHHNALITTSDKDFKAIKEFEFDKYTLIKQREPETYLIELVNKSFAQEIIENISNLYHKIITIEMEAKK